MADEELCMFPPLYNLEGLSLSGIRAEPAGVQGETRGGCCSTLPTNLTIAAAA